MQTTDYVIQTILSVFLIVGVYQFYFWCQRNHLSSPRELNRPIDDLVVADIPAGAALGWVTFQIFKCIY